MELNDIQRLAVAAALEKQVKKMTDTRAVDSLRARADDDLRAMFDETGVDRVRIRIGDQDVATLTLSFTKPVQGKEMRVDDAGALAEWLRTTDEGMDVLKLLLVTDVKFQHTVTKEAMGFGFLPDGCRMVDVDEPSRIKGTVLRVQPEKVAKALAGELPQAVAGLLDE